MSVSPTTDDLQDLSPADAQELRAFLDKRRWFEGKLTVLEALPPIYPFVHPNLGSPSSSAAGPSSTPVYLDHDNKQWRLPSEEDVRRSQLERDTLEEEILAFDGGDLMRMKQKTRAATLLPLTPPSTHLVSITLALIVVIDRLLTLLRHRGELLELTSARLQWDSLRWQIMQETARVRTEIDDIAKGKGKWVPPPQIHRARRTSNGPIPTPTGSPQLRSTALPPSSSVSSQLSAPETSPMKLTQSSNGMLDSRKDSTSSLASLAASNTPKRAMHLPLLRSNIANLEIRQRNLATTSVARSGKLLDKMIDLAIPLKDLGGIDGPGVQGEGGAVPDELLDMQDDLEEEVTEIETRISCCRALELQWGAADQHHLASTRARGLAEAILDDLLEASSQLPTDEQHRELFDRLAHARQAIPSPKDGTFPAPSHPSYPEHLEHTARLLEQLSQARAEAQQAVSTCDDALAWYAKLVAASDALEASRRVTEPSLADLRNVQSRLTVEGEGILRPNLDDISAIQNHSAVENWLRFLPAAIETSRSVNAESSDRAQRLTAAVMRYRHIARASPKGIREQLGDAVCLDLADEAEELADACQDELKRLAIAVTEATRDSAILSAVQASSTSASELKSRMMPLAEILASDVEPSAETLSTLMATLKDLQAARPAFVASVDQVHALLRTQERTIPPLSDYVAMLSKAVCSELDDLSNQVELVTAISKQTAVVSAIEAEAASFVHRAELVISGIQEAQVERTSKAAASSPTTRPLTDDSQVLQSEIEVWTKGLADRLGFIAPDESPTAGHAANHAANLRRESLLAATTSAAAPPMTPPASPPVTRAVVALSSAVGSTQDRDPVQCDNWARVRVNEASSRVNGRLAALLKELEALSRAPQAQSSDVFGTIATVPSVASTSVLETETATMLLRRLDDLQFDTLLYPSILALQQTPSYRQIPSSPKARRIREELISIRAGYEHLRSVAATVNAKDLASLDTALETAEDGLPRLDQLVAVSQAVKACDEAFSRLLDALDVYTAEDKHDVQTRQLRAEADIGHLRSTASFVLDDVRVAAEVKRTEASWHEMKTLVAETLDPVKIASTDIDAVSDTSSVVSMSSQTCRQPLSRPSARIASNPVQQPPRSMPEPRNRAASDTPSRLRLDSIQSGLPRLCKASMGPPNNVISPVTITGRARPTTPSSIPRPTRLSNASSVAHTTPTAANAVTLPRARKTSRLSAASIGPSSTLRPRKTYVADPKSKLDVAVGRIVNKLKVNVPIRPVSAEAADEWKDQSGKYWIGAEGRAKLCFCRILRSKTVMVRVGGGWVELSKFLQDHFADSFAQWDQSASGANTAIGAMGIGSATSVPITSASLSHHTPLRNKASFTSPMGTHGALTPRRAPDSGLAPGRSAVFPRSSSDKDIVTPQRHSASPGTSPRSASKPAEIGPGTPLVPLHFMRKASESPEVRQMEREKLVSGKRSILGRSHSGNVLSVSPEKNGVGSPGR